MDQEDSDDDERQGRFFSPEQLASWVFGAEAVVLLYP
jgi:hypothetical protein